MQRKIGEFTQGRPGPFLLCVGGMHGNEYAGIHAIREVLDYLKEASATLPDFRFRGSLVGLVGNLSASKLGVRFVDSDLNRMWTPERLSNLMSQEPELMNNEEKELLTLDHAVKNEFRIHREQSIVFLDLHTTSADGGIYSIVPENEKAISLATQLDSPVVLGILDGIQGTTLQYFNEDNFDVELTSLGFEAGMHDDRFSVDRAIAFILETLKAMGCLPDVSLFDERQVILRQYSRSLPMLTRLVYRQAINVGDRFKMLPGFRNFDPVKRGQLLAYDNQGEIRALNDGYILMPLYQTQGEDGFFIVQDEKR